MAKYQPQRLTDAFLRTLKKPGRHTDGPGSHGLTADARLLKSGQLVIFFEQRIRILQKVTTLRLGKYSYLTLKQARQKAAANTRAVQKGRDPRSSGKRTFEEIAIEYIELLKARGWWREGSRSYQTWMNSLRTYVFPYIGPLPPDQISSLHIIQLLQPIWTSINPTAEKIAGRISEVMDYAIAWELCETNPVPRALPGLGPVHTTTEHHKALDHWLLEDAIRTLAASGAHPNAINALILIFLTGVRSGEALNATWDQVDLDKGILTIPASKDGLILRVPLCDALIRVLKDTAPPGSRTGLIFTAPRGGKIYSQTLGNLLEDNGIEMDVHGARTCFRTWAKKTGIDDDLAEAVLAHGRTDDPYMRYDLLTERAKVLQQWADYLNI